MLMAPVLLSSCLKDDGDSSLALYPDMAITSFTLGTLNRYLHQTSTKSGNDTIVKLTYTGSLYPMTIDHVECRIYNEKPLPVGTDVAHVICTVGTKNNGVVYIKQTTNDSLFYHTSTDSVDLSQPRIFRVFAIDGSGSRDYTVTLDVSKAATNSVGWVRRTDIDSIPDMASKQLVAWGDSILLTDRNQVVSDGKSYGPFEGVQLIGSSTHEFYALNSDGKLVCSTDSGQTWQQEQADEQAELLPRENMAIVSWPYASEDNTDYVLMVGNDPTNDNAVTVWRKIAPHGGQAQWVFMPQDDTNYNRLPRRDLLSMVRYSNTVLAMGKDMVIYQSRDQGITWFRQTAYALPATVQGAAALLAVGGDGALWVVTDSGQVWHGALQ